MADLKISEIIEMQKELQEKYKGKWTTLSPESGRNSLLWMMEEVGEVISIIKKRGDMAIMEDQSLRADFIEEMVDIMMYYQDMLISYDISPEEWSEAFIKKHNKNMNRDFLNEHENYRKK
jgi:NTP pyrophosphatase (non-canonical NTP hydrolase)